MAYEWVVDITEDINHEDPTAEVITLCPWNQRISTARTFLGGWMNVGGFMQYQPPSPYIAIPGICCKKVATKWMGDINPYTGDWGTAQLTLSYGKPEIEYGELAFDVGAEAMSLPNTAGFKWASGPASGESLGQNDITPHVLIPTINIKLKRKLPWLVLDGIVNRIGRINSVPLFIGPYAFAAETVLSAGAQVTRKLSNDANELWQYDMCLIAKPFSWNRFFHKSGLQYITPLIYAQADHNWFFN